MLQPGHTVYLHFVQYISTYRHQYTGVYRHKIVRIDLQPFKHRFEIFVNYCNIPCDLIKLTEHSGKAKYDK